MGCECRGRFYIQWELEINVCFHLVHVTVILILAINNCPNLKTLCGGSRIYCEMSEGVICSTADSTPNCHEAAVRSAFQIACCFPFSRTLFHPRMGDVIVIKCLVERRCQLLT